MNEKTDDRLIYQSSFPSGYYNIDVEFKATEEGLECDLTGSLISWEWLDKAREILAQQGAVES